MRKPHPTIREIAALAEVSPTTVVNVLKGRLGRVGEDTRLKVDQARDLLQRAESSARTIVALLDSDPYLFSRSDFYGPVVASIFARVQQQGAALTLYSSTWPLRAFGLTHPLWERADAVIEVGDRLPTDVREELATRMPCALVGNPDAACTCPTVSTDDAALASEAAERLVQLGHRRLAYLPGTATKTDEIRGDQFRATALALGATVQILGEGEFWPENGAKASEAIASQPPTKRITGVFCFNDGTATALVHSLSELGLSCPGDVSVIGVDAGQRGQSFQPSIASFRQDYAELGSRAFDFVWNQLEGAPTEAKRTLLPAEFVPGESVGPPPG